MRPPFEKLHKHLTDPVWLGVARGVYEVSLDLQGATPIRIGLQQAVLCRKIHRLLTRISDNNAGVPVEKAWELLWPVRACEYGEGTYRGPDGVQYDITEWDCALLRRYDALLEYVYEANKKIVDELSED